MLSQNPEVGHSRTDSFVKGCSIGREASINDCVVVDLVTYCVKELVIVCNGLTIPAGRFVGQGSRHTVC